MRDILFLAHRVPFPPDRGDRIRSFHILKAVSAYGRVHLLSFADSREEAAAIDGLAPWVASARAIVRRRGRAASAAMALASGRPISLALFDAAEMRRAVMELLASRSIGLIYAFSGQMAQFVPGGIAPRFLMDFVDVDSAKFEGYAGASRGLWRVVNGREARRLAAFEVAVARRADLSLFVSEAEAALFRGRSGLGPEKVAVLENGVDLAILDPGATFAPPGAAEREGGPLILFTGQMDYPPNIEAVDRFARGVLPGIRARYPAARFAIVGRAPTAAVRALARVPGVTVTGEIADVRPWLAAADVVVAPLLLARGVQNKVLEALAMGRPVVASPAAFEGIDAQPGRHLMVAEAGVQADVICRLLADPVRRASLGRAARDWMVQRYAWERTLAPLAGMLAPGTAEPIAVAAE